VLRKKKGIPVNFTIGRENNKLSILVEPIKNYVNEGGDLEILFGFRDPYASENASADVELYEASPNTNYGSATVFGVGGEFEEQMRTRSLIRFNLSTLPPYAVTINSANLVCQPSFSLPPTNPADSLDPSGFNIYCYNTAQSWSENTATWNNMASNYGSSYALDFVDVGDSAVFSIATLVQNWCNNPNSNYGVMLKSNENSAWIHEFWSRESSYPPKLYITFTGRVDLTAREAYPGWTYPLIISRNRNATTNDSAFYADPKITYYVRRAVRNCSGYNIPASVIFRTKLYVDNQLKKTWTHTGLNAWTYDTATFYIGPLTQGNHTIKVITDADNNVYEANELNNEYYWTFEWKNPVVNISGNFFYRNRQNQAIPIKDVKVELWDDDPPYHNPEGDQQIGVTHTNLNGYFIFNNIYNVDEDSTWHDYYAKVCAYNVNIAQVVDSVENLYKETTFVHMDVPCGDKSLGNTTVSPDSLWGAAFHIFDVIRDGYKWAQNRNWENLQAVTCKWWPNSQMTVYCYPHPRIQIRGRCGQLINSNPDEWDWGRILHEYGHVLATFEGFNSGEQSPGHGWGDTISFGVGWNEGWAHYAPCCIKNSQSYWDIFYRWNIERTAEFNLENGKLIRYDTIINANALGPKCEASVAGVLWDIYDGQNDDQNNDKHGDSLTVGFDPIHLTLKTITPGTNHRPWTVTDFYNSWMARNGGFEQQLRDIYFEHGIQVNQPPQQQQNVNNPEFKIVPQDGGVQPQEGPTMFKISGTDASSSANSYIWWKYCDLNYTITNLTFLSFWLYNKSSPNNYGHFSIDGVTTDGYHIKDWSSGGYIVDQYGVRIHPAIHTSPQGEWRQYKFSLAPMQGKTLRSLSIGYDDGANSETGNFIAYFDDIKWGTLAEPSNLFINPVVYFGVQLYWTDNSAVEDGFKIEKKVGSGSYTVVHTTGPNETSWYDDDIEPYYNQQVCYRVIAFFGNCNSQPSKEVVFTPPGIFSDTLTAIDYYHSSRKLYRDNNGHYHLILKHHNRLWWTKSTDNGQSWSLARNLAGTGPETPSVVAASPGLPCFVWQEKTGTAPNFVYDIVYAYIDAQGNIHRTTLLDNTNHDLSPAMAITSDDQIYLAFIHTYGNYSSDTIACLKFNHSNPQYSIYCKIRTDFYRPENLRIAVDNSNYPHLVWDEYYFINYGSQAKEVRRIYHSWSTGSGSAKVIVAEGWLSGALRRILRAPDIRCVSNGIQICWRLSIEANPWVYEIYYRARSGNNWGAIIQITQDPAIGNYPACGRIIGGKVLCAANNKIFVTYPENPYKSAVLVENVNNYDAIPVPSGTVGGAAGIVYSKNTNIPGLYKLAFTIKTIPYIPPYNPVIVFSTPVETLPEFTAYNNSCRLLRDTQGRLHLVFTSNNQIYHTFLQDTSWSEPVLIGEGKYPTLALGPEGRIYCLWSYNQGQPDFLEELRFSQFDGSNWSSPVGLLHTYNSFFWGIGAPSLTIKDTLAYFCYKSYFGPTYHPEPGSPMPMVIILESRHLIYGKFPVNNPAGISSTSIDTILITPTPYDPLVYQDSLVPLLISPSITVDLANVPHILWEGDSTNMRYYTITDSGIIKQLFDNGVDFPFISMNGDQIQLFYTARDSIRYRYSWTGTTDLSQIQTIASCESPISSNQYLTWTKRENGISHLYYGAIPASGEVTPIEINYSTDLILHTQILFNPKPPSIDLVWTEYSEIDSLGYIYYLNLPLTEVAPKYAFDMGTETPVPILVQRNGYKTLGPEDYKTFDYDSTELIYHLTLHSPHIKYKIRWTYYHEEPNKLKLQFNIDDILHHNRWVNPGEKITEEAWIPDACVQDNEITIKVKRLSGTIAVLSGLEIETEEVVGGGPQGGEAQISNPFYFERIHPNPFKDKIIIRYMIQDAGYTIPDITLKIYDVTGRLVRDLSQNLILCIVNNKSSLDWYGDDSSGRKVPAGVYFVRLEAEGYVEIEKVIFLR